MKGHKARCDASRPTDSSLSDNQKTDASALAGEGSRNTSEQLTPNNSEGPTEQQGEVIVDRHRVPVLVVPAVGGPEGVAVNLSLYQQVTEESTARREENLQRHKEDIDRLEKMIRDVRRRDQGRRYPGRQLGEQYDGQHPCRGPDSLVGASAWRGGLMSRMAKDMLFGVLATTAGLWVAGIMLAICYVILRIYGKGYNKGCLGFGIRDVWGYVWDEVSRMF
jgi:hypothetical protein